LTVYIWSAAAAHGGATLRQPRLMLGNLAPWFENLASCWASLPQGSPTLPHTGKACPG